MDKQARRAGLATSALTRSVMHNKRIVFARVRSLGRRKKRGDSHASRKCPLLARSRHSDSNWARI